MSILSSDQKTIISVYALVFVGAIMMLIPFSLIPYAGLACMSVGMIAAYIYRSRQKDNDVMVFHMRYIIRTIWWSTLILTIGVVLFCSVLLSNGDMSAINNLMANAEKGIVPNDTDIQAMQYMFVQSNLKLISITAAMTLIPYPVYLIFRMIKGVHELVKVK